MQRYYYNNSISSFINATQDEILGQLIRNSEFDVTREQRHAWIEEIIILQNYLKSYKGLILFEFSIPRMGKRIDVVLIIQSLIFVIEFKVGEKEFLSNAVDQVVDYSLDLKNFHEPSHNKYIAPLLIATEASPQCSNIVLSPQNDNLFFPIRTSANMLNLALEGVLALSDGIEIDTEIWINGRYHPTPTIIEAAIALYKGHSVKEISRSDATAINLTNTSDTITEIIKSSKDKGHKSICFVTGVPGAGKTLVGLNIANQHTDKMNELYSVFLSGNGPLVAVLREALTRDIVRNEMERGNKIRKGVAMSRVKSFIQNVHNFRDECLVDLSKPPIEHVALFDESQRAWDLQQTANFMKRRKGFANFLKSEPEFLISCLDRHKDWAVIVCLVGGGQEINTGEAGISEWIDSLNRSFPDWHIYISSQLKDTEYGAGKALKNIEQHKNLNIENKLHLSVSLRSFRAENVSLLIKLLLDNNIEDAKTTLESLKSKYPIILTRDISKAKEWLKKKARGSERYGIVVSSRAERLRPQAINVKAPMDPVHWFLNDKDDVRSSYYLEDVATEFHIQGLELDWSCVVWDGDLRNINNGWDYRYFTGNKWNKIRKAERQVYLKNAYRVLLTRARQGMVIVVPKGDMEDPTRDPEIYNPTFEYLKEIGFEII